MSHSHWGPTERPVVRLDDRLLRTVAESVPRHHRAGGGRCARGPAWSDAAPRRLTMNRAIQTTAIRVRRDIVCCPLNDGLVDRPQPGCRPPASSLLSGLSDHFIQQSKYLLRKLEPVPGAIGRTRETSLRQIRSIFTPADRARTAVHPAHGNSPHGFVRAPSSCAQPVASNSVTRCLTMALF